LPPLDAFAAAQVRDEYDDDGASPVVRRQVQIRLSDVTGVLDAPRRQDLISVIVCDYAMPGMDGLEFFAQLGDPDIRRVLLTALCDEQRAVQAFNRGLIHQFVHKADAAGPRGLEAVLGAQVREFFRSRSAHLAAALALGPGGRLLAHHALGPLLERTLHRAGLREFSFAIAPPGFRLRGPDAEAHLLLADAAAFEHAERVVTEIDAPASLLAALRARSVLPTGRDGAPIYEAADDWPSNAVAPQIEAGAGSAPLFWALLAG
jgi:CheY-like chemotaxis protein